MNRLAEATSLYLRQHAEQPVDWHPWDDEALYRARSDDRPILVSIGYSACHWCHVMAHESFEDEETARWMNELFVNIKVDREERPDLDRAYQLAHQLLTGRGGGWPLTVFVDPHRLTPFFAGTYFPPAPRHGLPGFAEVLKKVRAWYDTRQDEVADQNQRLRDAIARLQEPSGEAGVPDESVFDSVRDRLRAHYDARNGGFGSAPKFPQAPLLGLVQWLAGREPVGDPGASGHMLHSTLTRMAMSGLRDPLDGGFFRYAVDASWTIPHFEKMLYDNAMLLPLYAEAAATGNDPFLESVADGVVRWLESAMRADSGGFFASIDADAGGVEGGFHVWQRDEIRRLLTAEEYAAFAPMFGLDQPPNFEGSAWHLLRVDGDPTRDVPASALDKLAATRAERTAPTTDRKHVTAWNALCVEGLARAGRALGREEWLDLAEDGLSFIRQHAWRDGRLYAVVADGAAHYPAYLDDHAGLLQATLELMQARYRGEYLELALALADALLQRFEDPDKGGFFFSDPAVEVPMQRLRPLQDDALPAGAGVAARALDTLGHLSGETRYLDAARRALSGAAREMREQPLAHASLLRALGDVLRPPAQVVIVGSNDEKTAELARQARSAAPFPGRLHCFRVGAGAQSAPSILGEVDFTVDAAAYLCQGMRCLPPVFDADALATLLAQEERA